MTDQMLLAGRPFMSVLPGAVKGRDAWVVECSVCGRIGGPDGGLDGSGWHARGRDNHAAARGAAVHHLNTRHPRKGTPAP